MARGEYARSAEVKRGILDACVAAFGETGFHGASMAEIARRAGISHTGLLHHFPRKEALLAAVLALMDARAAQYLEEHAAREGDDPVAVVRGLLESVVGHRRSLGVIELSAVLPAEATTPTHPAHEYFRERYAVTRGFLSRQFAALLEQGRLRAGLPPDQLAAVVIALVDGLRTQWLYEHDAIDVDGALVAVLGAFIPELDPE